MFATTIVYKIIVVVNYELVLITSVPVIIFHINDEDDCKTKTPVKMYDCHEK